MDKELEGQVIELNSGFNNETNEALKQELNQELIAYRDENWGGGRKIAYLETHVAIKQANRIFGFDGWSYEITDLTRVCEIVKTKTDRDGVTKSGWEVGIQCKVKINVDGVIREDVGYGTGIDYSSLTAAYESAGKEAASDALKRALRSFGNQFGNSLYGKIGNEAAVAGAGGTTTSAPARARRGGRPSGAPMIGQITENQVRFINKLAKDKGTDLATVLPKGKKLEEISKQDASEIIDKLNKQE
jgi:DNA repair and recombination protein RAD52